MRRRRRMRSGVWLATVSALAVIAAFVAGKAARDAILLSHFAVERLPLFLGASAVLSLPIIVISGRLMARFSPGRVLPWFNLASAALLVVEWLLLGQIPRITAVVVFLHLGSLGAVLVSGFWSIVNERFDVEAAKRYVGRIGVGATFGGILGGVIAERTAVYLEPGSILLVLGVLQLGCAIVLRSMVKDAPAIRPVPDEEVLARLSSIGTIWRAPLLRYVGILVILGAIGAAALDYVFKAEVVSSTHGDPLRMFALYQTGTAILTAVLQLAFAQLAVTKLGVPRTVGVLPLTLAGFSLGAIAFPGLGPTMVARGAEAVVRSSVYRAGYELLFAPLPEHEKRPTKVLLDVGAERVGDLLGAELVAMLIYSVAAPRTAILIAAGTVGVIAAVLASRLPRAYTAGLERSLIARTKDAPPPERLSKDALIMWSTLGAPTPSEAGAERSALSLPDLRLSHDVLRVTPEPAVPRRPEDPLLERIAALRSRERRRVTAVLADGMTRELVPFIVPLVAWDDVASPALKALTTLAPQCTGLLVDVLLDIEQEFAIRRRLPAVLTAGEPRLAAHGLWLGFEDPRFEVRYRCGRALGTLRAAGNAMPFVAAELYMRLDRELSVETALLRNYRLLDPDVALEEQVRATRDHTLTTALAHVFNLLALVLPAGPVRIAFESLHSTDRFLRATALEYLESALPEHLRAKLWPLIAAEGIAPSSSHRSRAELAQALLASMSNPRRI